MKNIFFILSFIQLFYIKSYSQSYNPTSCNVTNYSFTFIYDNKSDNYKIHGLWPEHCSECYTCGYPSCCNINKINYTYPNDPDNFIGKYWYNSSTIEQCILNKNVILFEHEYYKHISCTNINNTQEFLIKIKKLYEKYYDKYVNNNCKEYSQLWLNLDYNFNYINTSCLS
jgi:ribonuclease I